MLVFQSSFSSWPFWQVSFHVVVISVYCFILSTAGCNKVIVFIILQVWLMMLFQWKINTPSLSERVFYFPWQPIVASHCISCLFFPDTKFIFAKDTSTVNTKEKVTILLKGHELIRKGARNTTSTPHHSSFLYSLHCSASSPIILSLQKSFSCKI